MAMLDELSPALLRTVLALRAGGRSYQAIAAELNRRQMKSALGCRWYAATVFRLVRLLSPSAGRRPGL
jgi:hypothetical protein